MPRGVNSARGWSRVARAYAVEAVGVLVAAVVLALLLLVPATERAGDVALWGLLLLTVLVPVVAASAIIVWCVRLRIAPVGLVTAALLVAWGWGVVGRAESVVPWWVLGLVLSPAVAALVTHPRPHRADED